MLRDLGASGITTVLVRLPKSAEMAMRLYRRCRRETTAFDPENSISEHKDGEHGGLGRGTRAVESRR